MNSTFDKKRVLTTPKISRADALKAVNIPLYLNWRGRQACLAKAAATPLPGSLLGAFMDGAIKIRDKEVCRIVPAHFFILQKIDSKLLKLISMAQAERTAAVEMTAHEEWDICYIFTNDPKKVFELVREGGVEALRKESQNIATDWEPELIEGVILAVIEQMKRHVETKVKLLSDLKDSGSLTFFRELKTPDNTTKTE